MAVFSVRESVIDGVIRDANAFVQSNPELAILIGIGLLAVLAGGVLLYRYLTRPPGVRLAKLLGAPDEITILMHPNPDPDAMACAIGLSFIAETQDTNANLLYPGQIRHQENRAFRTVLDLDMENITGKEDLRGKVVLVDHNEARGFTGAEAIKPFAVVDHHPGDGTGERFTDVRPEYGACATIIAEYLQELGGTPVGPDATAGDVSLLVPSRIATGLLYGIHADTKNLTKGCTSAEFEAYSYLYQGVDSDALDRIANPEVDVEVLEVKARAIKQRTVNGSFAVADVGDVSNVDAIPQAADELLRLEGVTAVVIQGSHNGTLHLSGRSRDDRVHMGDTLAAVVEDIPMSSAGGHARMGGGQISIEHMNGLGPGDGTSREELETMLFDAMAGDV